MRATLVRAFRMPAGVEAGSVAGLVAQRALADGSAAAALRGVLAGPGTPTPTPRGHAAGQIRDSEIGVPQPTPAPLTKSDQESHPQWGNPHREIGVPSSRPNGAPSAESDSYDEGNPESRDRLAKALSVNYQDDAELVGTVPLDFDPQTEEEMIQALRDPLWRICSGKLYKIMVKSADKTTGETVVPFRPNRAQKRFLKRLWHRNIILKARQLGFTTLIAIMWLDHALFNPDQRCVVIAQDRETAEAIFRDKVKLAYDRLPESIKATRGLQTENKSELLFDNNSSVRVVVSARSGTVHRLHVSEFGKIGAADPAKAKEVVTGSFPAVPDDGICIVESTAEGQQGEFYELTKNAVATAQTGRPLSVKDFRFHFYPWWQEPEYRLSDEETKHTLITPKDHEYFDEVEAKTGASLDMRQRAWYCATRQSMFGDDPEKMWQEYPSHHVEAFQVSNEGCYYAVQLAQARKEGRIRHVPHTPGFPVNTYWDIGNSDGTAIWLHQRIGLEDRFIGFLEGWNEPYDFFVQQLQEFGYIWGTHYLPHDADHQRQQGDRVASPREMLEELSIGGSWEIVPKVDQLIHGIQAVRRVFSTCIFDATECAPGLAHLGNYRKTWDRRRACWKIDQPQKLDGHSEAADAFRQFAQAYELPRVIEMPLAPRRNWRVA